MSKGGFQNPKYANQSGTTSGYGSQGNFGMGYTQPYGSPGTGTYDPMLGFGQASGMGTTYNYPTRYSADYTRYAQSGQPFNPAVMGYNSYGQIFAQPRQQRPPPSMGKGGVGFQPQPPAGGGKGRVGTPRVPRGGTGNFLDFYTRQNNPANSIFEPRSQPPTVGGKGGPRPINDGVTISYPGGSRTVPRSPERRTNQLGLNNPPPNNNDFNMRTADMQDRNLDGIDDRDQGPVTGGPGATPPPLTGGVPTDSVGGFGPGQLISQERPLNPNDFQPLVQPEYAYPTDQLPQVAYEYNQAPTLVDGLPVGPVAANRPVIDENIYNSPFGQLIGGGLGGMPTSGPQIRPDYIPVMGERNFDMQDFNMLSQPFNFGQGFGRMAFQEGGQVPPDANMEMMMAETAQPEMAGEYDRLIQMTMQAILGQVESPDEVIQMFIDEFGVDAFRQLRDAVLKQQVPGAQTEGMVDGNGGGMDDQVMGMIGNQRPVAVSPGEYIVPADVVSGLGDGSSKAGADMLDELNQAVRMARTGTAQQPRPLMETLQQ